MPEVALRFAVFAADGRATDIWKVWANRGSGKRDVYMVSRPHGYSMKLSLHERGQWQVGFHSDKRDVLFDPGCAPESRFLGQWDAAVGRAPITLAASVMLPWSSPTINHVELPEGLVRIPSAPERKAVEVALFLLDYDDPPDSWPGKNSMGTSFVGRIPLDGGGGASLVSRIIDMPAHMPEQHGNPRYFAGKSQQDLHTANRLVAWGQGDDGSICFMEAPLEVHIPRVG